MWKQISLVWLIYSFVIFMLYILGQIGSGMATVSILFSISVLLFCVIGTLDEWAALYTSNQKQSS